MLNNSTGRYFSFFVVYLLAIFSRFLQPGDLYLSYFTDDFFYYYKIAENLNNLGISSFDGIHLTNGYHPLWMLVIAGLYKATGPGLPLFVATALVFCVVVSLTYALYEKISNHIFGDDALTRAGSLLSAIFIGVLARTGMEISLAAFFIALFFYRCLQKQIENQSTPELLLTGLVASLVFLARIDAIIPVFLFLLLKFATAKSKVQHSGKIIVIATGALLIPAYLTINWLEFKTLLPISGMAKQLKTSYGFSLTPLLRMADFNSINIIFTWPAIIFGFYSIKTIFLSPIDKNSKTVIAAFLLHPMIFYVILCFKSDWPSWTWYLYPIPPIACLTIPFFKERNIPLKNQGIAALLAFYSIVAIAGIVKTNPGAIPIYETAKQIAEFAKNHPGIYAMGDRAGTPAYFLTSPLVQLEGLVGDKYLLENIKTSTDLGIVLKELKIDYYVTSNHVIKNDCYHSIEPAQAGPASPVMVGIFCNKNPEIINISGIKTLIFHVSQNHQTY